MVARAREVIDEAQHRARLLRQRCRGARRGPAGAEERLITIVHTNGTYSHLQGFSPEGDYSPLVTGMMRRSAGFRASPRSSGACGRERANPVLAIDAGDFLMGACSTW